MHVIGPEQGLTQPGMIVVCGDSHTATHGAFGALAFGIGTSEVEHVLASQCLLQRKSKTYRVLVDGVLPSGVGAKDIILNLISRIGIGGGNGCVIEYCGSAIRALSMEERMTVCNMSIEAGAKAGMIAPDDITYEYIKGRPFAPKGAAWDSAVARWKQLPTDDGATYDKEISIDAGWTMMFCRPFFTRWRCKTKPEKPASYADFMVAPTKYFFKNHLKLYCV